MPTYEYRCGKCGEHLEAFQSFSDAPLTKHSGCGGKLAKVLSPAGIVLKGSGFYKTDSRSSKSASRTKSSESSSSESKSSSTSEKSSDTKSSGTSGDSSSSSSSGASDSGSSKPTTKSA
jgi:putative FmdB family regulatory protein